MPSFENGPHAPHAEVEPRREEDPVRGQIAEIRTDLESITAALQSDERREEALADLRMFTEHLKSVERDVGTLEEHATVDELTEVANKRYFLEEAQRLMSLAERLEKKGTPTPVHVLYIDLDKFKPVNDALGHEAGDLYLKTIAREMKDTLRESDTLARLGGDEFAVFLFNADAAGAHVVAQHLLEAVVRGSANAKRGYENKHGQKFPAGVGDVTASIGLAERYKEEALESLLRRTDAAMYAVKEGGRGNVLSYDELMGPREA